MQAIAILRRALREEWQREPLAREEELKAQLAACFAPVDLRQDHQLYQHGLQ